MTTVHGSNHGWDASKNVYSQKKQVRVATAVVSFGEEEEREV